MNYTVTPETGFFNFSAFAFRRWGIHYYKCRHDFENPHKFSPVPYFLLCRAIELELKARHLEKKRQPEVRRTFGHRIKSAYLALPKRQQVLDAKELAVLKQANAIYATKGFEYILPRDAATAYKRFPDLDVLDRIAKKLLGV
ncbi:MAG TPA: hypothetical protein VGJ48_26995 [Pyrinomonadaceae bacterium]|jgi:hypothetical protein